MENNLAIITLSVYFLSNFKPSMEILKGEDSRKDKLLVKHNLLFSRSAIKRIDIPIYFQGIPILGVRLLCVLPLTLNASPIRVFSS